MIVDTPVLIVGGGPVGLALALDLGMRGDRSTIVEKDERTGAQLLVSESGEAERDGLHAFEIPDRDPVAASSAMEFDGQIVALWPETSGNGAMAVVKRKDTGWYEAYRVSVSCSN